MKHLYRARESNNKVYSYPRVCDFPELTCAWEFWTSKHLKADYHISTQYGKDESSDRITRDSAKQKQKRKKKEGFKQSYEYICTINE